jgi:hypothetical protein
MLRVGKKNSVFFFLCKEHVKGKEETDRTKQKRMLITTRKGRTKINQKKKFIFFKMRIAKQQKVLSAINNNMKIRQICFSLSLMSI